MKEPAGSHSRILRGQAHCNVVDSTQKPHWSSLKTRVNSTAVVLWWLPWFLPCFVIWLLKQSKPGKVLLLFFFPDPSWALGPSCWRWITRNYPHLWRGVMGNSWQPDSIFAPLFFYRSNFVILRHWISCSFKAFWFGCHERLKRDFIPSILSYFHVSPKKGRCHHQQKKTAANSPRKKKPAVPLVQRSQVKGHFWKSIRQKIERVQEMSKNQDQSIDLSEAWWFGGWVSRLLLPGFGGFGVGISTRWIWRIWRFFYFWPGGDWLEVGTHSMEQLENGK